jgi:cysteine desulfurase
VSIMLANNETGVIQPVAAAAERAHAHGALLHCDAVQGVGRIPLSLHDLGADLMSLSAHKMGGPQGAGALVVRDGVDVSAMLHGGRQEAGRRAGSENVAALIGFGVAADLAADDLKSSERMSGLRDRIEAELTAAAPDARVLGDAAPRLANTTCITMPGVAAETQVMALDLAGVAVSSGAACSSGKVGPSHVLAAMAVEPAVAACAVRISLGWDSTEADADLLIEAWTVLYRRTGRNDLRRRSSTR